MALLGGDSILDRTTSGFPLSISTGLAMETLFTPIQQVYDPSRIAPVKADLRKYNQLWINIATLYRNMVSASDPTTVLMSSVDEVSHVLVQEMEVIDSLLKNEGMGLCTSHFYCVDYDHVFRHVHKSIKKRVPSTARMINIDALYREVEKKLLGTTSLVTKHEPKIKPPLNTKALILSHYPHDLLSYKYFHQLDLLESNTGKIKTRVSWNSKYAPVGAADLSKLPFMKTLLMLLGDKALIHPNIFKLRDLIVQTSIKRNWTPFTTREKVIFDLESEIKEPFVMMVIRSIH